MAVVGGGLSYWFYTMGAETNPIAPEVYQSFNPLYITPKKIGIGMVIASLGFVILVIGSFNLISPVDLQVLNDAGEVTKVNPVPDSSRIMPYWLMSTYLVLTFAELFLSPMGLSFVSKVAPTRFQGVMQGGWLLATAVGNKLLFIGSFFWEKIQLWQLWAIFVVTCLVSAVFIFLT